MKIMWSRHNAWKGESVTACLVPDDYQPTDHDRACAVAPPQPIPPDDWSFARGSLARLMTLYPCPAPQAIRKVVKG